MQRMQGFYALIQFGAVPERMEFLNLGVVLAVPGRQFVGSKFAEGHSRIDRFFGPSQSGYVQKLKASLCSRLRMEFDRSGLDGLMRFAEKRANDIRISPFLPIAVEDPENSLLKLFAELVGEDVIVRRRPRMARRLKEAFVEARVYGMLEEKPQVVELPQVGISVRAPFGYQNGAYNLIDGMNFGSDRNDAMKEAGKRALEGDLLWKYSVENGDRKRLVVVADFGDQPFQFYDAVGEQLEKNHVRLYRLDKLGPLIDDIKEHASLHPN